MRNFLLPKGKNDNLNGVFGIMCDLEYPNFFPTQNHVLLALKVLVLHVIHVPSILTNSTLSVNPVQREKQQTLSGQQIVPKLVALENL